MRAPASITITPVHVADLVAEGHTDGTQVVVVETGARPVVLAGDAAVWFGELDEPQTEGQRVIRGLDPEMVWLAHAHEPWRPHAGSRG
jgi:N-acyl homoserine lactone hydrolase